MRPVPVVLRPIAFTLQLSVREGKNRNARSVRVIQESFVSFHRSHASASASASARVALASRSPDRSIARVSHFTRRRRTFTRFRGRIAAGRARALLNVVGTLSASVSTLKSIVTVVSRPSHRVERARFKPYLGSRPSRSSSSSSRLRAHVPSAQRVRLVTARTKRTSTLSFLTHGFLSRSRRRASV